MLERDVLVLFYLNELSLIDIAEIAAVPVGTVKSRLFRARRMLKTQLIGKGFQP
jgi:RNA polymerase sigma-70 factor (ECF subfamily)